MNRRDHRLRRALDLGQHVMKARRNRRLAELGDVGAGDEGAAGAGQNDRLYVGIGNCALDAIHDAAAHGGAQRVHRRTVDRDDGNHVMTLKPDHFVHGTLPGSPVLA